jgi:hypothetical protein
MCCIHNPRITEGNKLFHLHFVATLHLVVTSGKDVIQISRVVNVIIHVDVVRPDLEFGLKFGMLGSHRIPLAHDTNNSVENQFVGCLREGHEETRKVESVLWGS